jgi:hypothetical protein
MRSLPRRLRLRPTCEIAELLGQSYQESSSFICISNIPELPGVARPMRQHTCRRGRSSGHQLQVSERPEVGGLLPVVYTAMFRSLLELWQVWRTYQFASCLPMQRTLSGKNCARSGDPDLLAGWAGSPPASAWRSVRSRGRSSTRHGDTPCGKARRARARVRAIGLPQMSSSSTAACQSPGIPSRPASGARGRRLDCDPGSSRPASATMARSCTLQYKACKDRDQLLRASPGDGRPCREPVRRRRFPGRAEPGRSVNAWIASRT